MLLCVEDGFMTGRVPPEERTPGAVWAFEHRRTVPPPDLAGHHPLWITGRFLADAAVDDGRLVVGEVSFSCLVVEVAWLEAETLARVVEVAESGMPVVRGRAPRQPGTRRVEGYADLLARLRAVAVASVAAAGAVPLLDGPDLPPTARRRMPWPRRST